jgi:dipeptidyl aminopeptidase/acylaminoacyl peptidase
MQVRDPRSALRCPCSALAVFVAVSAFLVSSFSPAVAQRTPRAAAPAPAASSVATVPGPAFEDVIALRGIGGMAVSPDGRSVAFTVRTTDWTENRYESQLWLARDGAEPFQLTRGGRGAGSAPQWSQDGRWIAFLADRGDGQQVHLIRPDGGEAQKVTAVKDGVSSFRWAPDGRRLALLVRETEGDVARERRQRFGEFAVAEAEFRHSHLWLVDVQPDAWPAPVETPCPPAAGGAAAAGAGAAAATTAPAGAAPAAAAAATAASLRCVRAPDPVRLTGGDFTVGSFAWSPDGTRIAFERRSDPLITSGNSSDLWLADVPSGEVRPLVEAPGAVGSPVWSPDSRWILYSSAGPDTTTNYYTNGMLFRVSAAGGTPSRLAADFDEWISNVSWNQGGIYFNGYRGTRRHLFSIDAETGAVSTVATTPDVIFGYDFAADGRTLVLLGQTATTLPELYRTTLGGGAPVTLTSMSRQVADWGIGTAEVIEWTSTDGERIEGVLHKPRNFDPSQRYPLLVVIHGGPTGIDYPAPVTGYVYPVMQWLAKGALVLRPNYRGSAGYGERFRSLNVRNLGVGDAWDVESGVDHLVRIGMVDSTRVGAMGWSQGGYISAFLATTSARFRAISVGAGISNWMTYYVNTDITPFTRQYLQGTPWDDPEIYAKTSPMTYIRQARTPTLIQHGEFDQRVPTPNAWELYRGLSDVGVETRLIVYRGFGHGINKPREHLAALWHNWEWFGRHLWGEEIAAPAGIGATGR